MITCLLLQHNSFIRLPLLTFIDYSVLPMPFSFFFSSSPPRMHFSSYPPNGALDTLRLFLGSVSRLANTRASHGRSLIEKNAGIALLFSSFLFLYSLTFSFHINISPPPSSAVVRPCS